MATTNGSGAPHDEDEDALPLWQGCGGPDAAGVGQTRRTTPQPGVTVLSSPARSARFMRCDAPKNLPGSYYEVRRPEREGRLLCMPLGEWRRCWRRWSANKLLLKVSLSLSLRPKHSLNMANRVSSVVQCR
jgi:hypothetical protein